jgi:SAM-dependent methyltransferase
MTATSATYDRAFFEQKGRVTHHSAERIVPLVLSILDVQSVVDVGCGEGSWLAEFRHRGLDDLLGLDGDYVPKDLLKIPAHAFLRSDLSREVTVDRRFDLAMSLEVGEHLPPSRAASFVADLCRLSDQVLFSAAIPFQRGLHHVNCQWPDYWQDLFKTHDYVAFDLIRPQVWDDDSVDFWYRQNSILYVKRATAERHAVLRTALAGADRRVKRMVHPDLCDRFDSFSVRELLAMLPSATKRALARRMGADVRGSTNGA